MDSFPPSAVFAVISPIVKPIVADEGQYLVLWISNPDYSLCVVDRDRRTLLRQSDTHCANAISYILHLACDNVVELILPSDVSFALLSALSYYPLLQKHGGAHGQRFELLPALRLLG